MTTYQFYTVDQWGGKWDRPPVMEAPLDLEAYLHQTAGNPMSTITGPEAFRILNGIAINGKGYSFMDYDAVVHVDKKRDHVSIGEGRGKYMSAATLDRNEIGEAVVTMGYFHPGSIHSERPDIRHVTGAAMGFSWLRNQRLIIPKPRFLGHRDNPAHLGATACPGDYWYDYDPKMGKTPFEKMVDIYYDLETSLPPEIEIMAETMNCALVRPRGKANQYVLLEINLDNRKRWGIDHNPVEIELSGAEIAAIEAQNGNPMTPL